MTTLCRYFRRIWWLWRRFGLLAAFCLSLCVLFFDRVVLSSLSLPSCCLPTAKHTQTFRILAIALVPTLRLVFASTALAQAGSSPQSSRTCMSTTIWIIMTTAHGSAIPRDSPGRAVLRSPWALIETQKPIYTSKYQPDTEGDGFVKGVAKDTSHAQSILIKTGKKTILKTPLKDKIRNTLETPSPRPAPHKRSQLALFCRSVSP